MNWWNSLTDLQRLLASIAAPATLFMVLQFILMLFGLAHEHDVDSADGADHDLNLHDASDGGSDHSFFSGHDATDGHEIFGGHDAADGHEIFGGHDVADGHDVIGDHGGLEAHDSPDGHDSIAGHEHDGTDHNDCIHDKTDALRLFTLRGIVAFFSIGGWMGVVAIDWKLPDILAIILALAAGWLALWFVAWIIRAFVRMQQSGNIKIENAVGCEGEVYLTIPVNGRGKVNVLVQDRLCEMEAVSQADRPIKTGEKIRVLGVAQEGTLLVAPKSNTDQESA